VSQPGLAALSSELGGRGMLQYFTAVEAMKRIVWGLRTTAAKVYP